MNIANRILELSNQRDISINRLAELSDITQSTLNSIMNNSDPNPQYKTIEKICHGLGITLADFFAEAEPEFTPELRRLLETVMKLTAEQRNQLQKLLETMIAKA
ncbi:MAG: sinR 2 [Firmicutes bacterium]|nr:sinR 2 [Bacillota bacterium]